jgi:hypothetical protein
LLRLIRLYLLRTCVLSGNAEDYRARMLMLRDGQIDQQHGSITKIIYIRLLLLLSSVAHD